jgi:hypothetical protein
LRTNTAPERQRAWSGGALVAVSASVGLLAGMRAAIRVDLPGLQPLLELDGIPREGLGIAWSARALWPADIQASALERLLVVLCALALSAVLVATLNALILLAESAANRRAELAVRSAVGATPGVIARMLRLELRPLLTAGAALGLLAGLAGGGAARALWPGPLASVSLRSPIDVLVAVAGLVGALTAVYVHGGLRAARPERAASVLRAGTRTGADPMAVFARKALTAGHTSLAGTLLVGTLALSGTLGAASEGANGGDGDGDEGATVAYTATAPRAGAWSELLARIAGIPGIEAESLAAPGALLGLGIREVATAECGNCSRGLMPAPLWNVLADHHAVSPGFFELAGIEVLSGRPFTASDGPDAEPVILVNETFARTAFERGLPIGKRVRIGSDLGSWYRVIGVVADHAVPVIGADASPKEVVYLSALQQSPRSGALLLRGSGGALDRAEATMAGLGFAAGPRRTLREHRANAARPLRWAYMISAFVAGLALLLAGHGVYATALQTTRRRIGELAIRRALGASQRRIVAYVLLDRLRVVAWGLAGFAFLGMLAVALLQSAAGLPLAPPGAYLGIAFALAALAIVASARAAREATAVEPGVLLE